MNKIKTTAPIQIEDLKKYFEDKTTFFVIDYTESSLKSDKLLTYISNLDIPCDVVVNTKEEVQELVSAYLDSISLVNLPSVEEIVISLLLQHKGIIEVEDSELLGNLKEQLDQWTKKIDSLPLFNMYIIQDEQLKSWVVDEHDHDDTSDMKGVNFVSLLKHEDFYSVFQKIENTPKYYSVLFNEYMFKGKNLYAFWANANNPMFLLTHAISTNSLDIDKYVEASKNSLEELTKL